MHHGAARLGLHAHFPQAWRVGRLCGAGEARTQARRRAGPLQLLAGHLQVAAAVVVAGDSRQRCLILLLFFRVSRQGLRSGNQGEGDSQEPQKAGISRHGVWKGRRGKGEGRPALTPCRPPSLNKSSRDRETRPNGDREENRKEVEMRRYTPLSSNF